MTALPADENPRAASVVLGAFVLVTVFFVNLFPARRGGEFSQSPNEFSRFELVVSMAERRTFSIDRELSVFGDHEDKSVFGGHFYSNKAPGLSFAALPFYEAYRVFLGPAGPGHSTAMFYLLRVSTVSLMCGIALSFFSRRLRRVSAGSGVSAAILFAVAFGTPFLVYARSFFSHAWVASLIYLAFECIDRPGARRVFLFGAGLLAGWAVLSEYPAALLAAVLTVECLRRHGVRGGSWFFAGALPAAVLLGVYDAHCFGGIFELSSRHEAFGEFTKLSRSTLFGFGLPSPRIAWSYLFSPSRGVIFQSPFLLLLPAAYCSRAIAGAGWRAARNVSAAALVMFFVAMCGYENWHGGWALGSRYLVPVLLLAVWPLASIGKPRGGADTGARPGDLSRWFLAITVSGSAAYFFLSGSTFWFLPLEPANTIRFYSGFWLSRGWIAPTLAGSGWVALAVPFAATVIAAIAAFRPLFGETGRSLLALAAGALLCAFLFVGPPPGGTFDDRLTRARLLEGFTSLDPNRIEIRKLAAEARTAGDMRSLSRVLARPSPTP